MWKHALDKFLHCKPALAGLCLLGIIALFAVLGPLVSGYAYDEMQLESKNQSPGQEFWFGSDELGRDLFTRVCYGARISLFIGIAAALIDMLLGAFWGGFSALAGGVVDQIMMRIVDVLCALPYLLVVILILVLLGPGLTSILVAMTIIGWITMARIVRGQVMQIKTEDYVMAAAALGASRGRVLFRHIFPNAFGVIIVTLTMTIPSAIFTESFLSFLGLGVQVPMASWGTLVNEGLPAMSYYPWRLFFPAIFISITILAFNLVGEGLRDAFDIKEMV